MSYSRKRIHALDIETDNSNGHGLNPDKSRITELAIQGHNAETTVVLADESESSTLFGVRNHLTKQPPGLIVTWNGTFFDLPFMHTRSGIMLAATGLSIEEDPDLKPKYELLPGYNGGVIGTFESNNPNIPHMHMDIAPAYKQFAADHGVPWSLKPVCAAAGIGMYELDRTRLEKFTPEQRRRYVLSDTNGTLELAYRLFGI